MISKCISSKDYDLAKEIVLAYVEWLDIDLSFQDYDSELQYFETIYGPPVGAFFKAVDDSRVIGGVGLRQFASNIGEVKRLFVLKEHKGKGIARQLVNALIEEAQVLGYQKLLLDTLPSMTSAQTLYKKIGFRPTKPYRESPIPGTKYMQLVL